MPSETALILVGTSHRQAPIEIREQIAFDGEKLLRALRDVVAEGTVREAVIVSTCNRVEIVAAVASPDRAAENLRRFVASYHGLAMESLEPFLYQYFERDAVLHLFRVAASLDSMVLGEAQILGQVKEAFARACDQGTAGPVLRDLFPRAFRAAKRIRSETAIAASPLSVSSIAVDLARRIFGRLDDKAVLLVGAGKMSLLAARQFIRAGAGRVWVTARNADNAARMATEISGSPLPYQNLTESLVASDVVVVSTGAPHFIIEHDTLAQVMRQRRNRPIFIIDISVPRNVDPSTNKMDNVFLYDMDDLQGLSGANQEGRSREAPAAEAIIQSEVDAFLRELDMRQSAALIVELRESIVRICSSEVARMLQKFPDLPPDSRDALESMAQRISNKISHPFLTQLRANPLETSRLLSAILDSPADPPAADDPSKED